MDFSKIMIIFMSVFAACFAVQGLISIIAYFLGKKGCTDKREAVFVRNESSKLLVSRGRRSLRMADAYQPVFKYSWEDKEYFYEAKMKSVAALYKKGDKIEVFCDPSDPARSFAPKTDMRLRKGIILMILAAGIFTMGIFSTKNI